MPRFHVPVPLVGFLAVLFLSSLAFYPAVAAGLNAGVKAITLEELFPDAVFDPEVPTQVSVTGVEIGQRPLRPEEVLAYFQALADASPRARLLEYGRSHEDRPMVILAVSDVATIGDMGKFKQQHTALMDPRQTGKVSAEDLATTKAVAWMAYGIHGDELSSTDAAASLAYLLVAGEDEVSKKLRTKLLVLIDPCENPDRQPRPG